MIKKTRQPMLIFPNVVVAGRCHVHAASDAMFRQPAWLCLHFAPCIVT